MAGYDLGSLLPGQFQPSKRKNSFNANMGLELKNRTFKPFLPFTICPDYWTLV